MLSRIYPCEFAELPEHLPVTIGPEEPDDVLVDHDFDYWEMDWDGYYGGEWDYDYVPDDDDDYPPEYNEDWDWE